jgi:tRNA threonylcarbamoyladenosine biosynthesis protein TsaB
VKILGIDSSGNTASLALLENEVLIAEYTINHKKTHSQTLLPMMEAMLSMAETDVSELDAIAIASGPGSFTGLRIGAANAKGIAGALKIPIIPVPTLEALSYHCSGWSGVICPLMDARRNQVYTGVYEWNDGRMTIHVNQEAMPIDDILAKINEINRNTIFLGDGVPVCKNEILEKTKVYYEFAPIQDNQQSAGSVAVLGKKLFQNNIFVSAEEYVPIYLRLSQAEREQMRQKAE